MEDLRRTESRTEPRVTRGRFLKTSGVAVGAAGLAGFGASTAGARRTAVRARKLEQRTIVAGRQPFSAISAAISHYFISNPALLKNEAAKAGYDVEVEWKDFPNAQPIMELFKSGSKNMGFAFIGNTPVVTAIANKLPVQVVTTGEGTQPFYLLVRPDSKIKTLADLKGKTVGTVIGADPQNAFIQVLRSELGRSPEELDIKFVNFPTLPLLASLPGGIDAAAMVPWSPAYTAIAQKKAVALVDTLGRTGPAYKGGAGQTLPGVKRSPFAPEGYYEYRPFWSCHADLIRDDPKLVQAFIVAYQKALVVLKGAKPAQIAKLQEKEWGQPIQTGVQIVTNDLLWHRGWVWLVEGDVVSVVTASQALAAAGNLKQALTWDDVKAHLQPIAQLQYRAWIATGKVPKSNDFRINDEPLREMRGYPVWQMAKWGKYANRKVA